MAKKCNVELVKKTNKKQCKKKKTKKELSQELYKYYLRGIKDGTRQTPIGRKTPLTEQEFCKRYMYGVGASSGFDRDGLEYLLETEKQKYKKK